MLVLCTPLPRRSFLGQRLDGEHFGLVHPQMNTSYMHYDPSQQKTSRYNGNVALNMETSPDDLQSIPRSKFGISKENDVGGRVGRLYQSFIVVVLLTLLLFTL